MHGGYLTSRFNSGVLQIAFVERLGHGGFDELFQLGLIRRICPVYFRSNDSMSPGLRSILSTSPMCCISM